MSKEVIAQYLADMEKDDFVFVHPTTTEKDTAQEAEEEDTAKEAEVVATASSWADEVEEEILAAEDKDTKDVESWAAVAAVPATPKSNGRWSNWISLKNVTEHESTKPQNMNCSDLDQANLDLKRPNLVFNIN